MINETNESKIANDILSIIIKLGEQFDGDGDRIAVTRLVGCLRGDSNPFAFDSADNERFWKVPTRTSDAERFFKRLGFAIERDGFTAYVSI